MKQLGSCIAASLMVSLSLCLYDCSPHAVRRRFGGNVTEVPRPVWIAKLQSMACELVANLQRRNGPDSVHHFALGFHEETYIQMLADKIRAASACLLADPPRRLWLTCGSATVLQALSRVFPSTHYQVVQVGRNIWPDLLEGIIHTKFVAPERFASVAQSLPPYPSVSTYDAKLWQFVVTHGQEGDFIWNVGCDVPVPLEHGNNDSSVT